MATIQDLISTAQPASSGGGSIAGLMAGAGLEMPPAAPPEPAATPSTAAQRFGTGVIDPAVKVAQLAGHVFGQEKISPQERAAYGVGPDEDVSFDKAVAEREKAYNAGRAAARSTGFDWARTAGNVASPFNYMIPAGGAATTAGRIGMAGVQGAVAGALQPVTDPNDFWATTAKQTGAGALAGLVTGGAIEALARPLSWAARGIKNFLGFGKQDAAQGVIDETLEQAGIKPQQLPPEFVDSAREQIAHAAETGGTVDPITLRAQAEAASLPIPIKLPRGQASGDPAQYAAEQEAAKIAGKGPNPALQLMTENNQKLIDNLDVMGAKAAPTAAEGGTAGLTALAKIDQKLDAAKNAAYGAVRDSQGRAAKLDPEAFYMNAEGALERDNSGSFLPANIRPVYEDITEGRLPFTVDTMTNFDKILSRAQRTTTDGNAAHAIGLVRSALADTPVADEMGQQAAAAYQKARGLARAQFALSDPKEQTFIPGFAAMLKAMGNSSHQEFISALEGGTANIDPAQWFTSQVMKATPGAAKKLMGFLQQGDDSGVLTKLQGATMGAIRDAVVQGNDAIGRATFSNNAMRKVMDREDTLREILPSDAVDTLGRLYNTSGRISGVPYKSAVNWSNTAAASANLQTLKEAGGVVGGAVAGAIPGGRQVMAAGGVVSDLAKRRAARAAAQAATQPLYATPGSSVGAVHRGAYLGVPAVSLSRLMNQSGEQ